MWKEFREFAVKGNAIDLAVGIIIGAAFGSIVTSLVEQIIMPPIGLLLGGVDFSNIFSVLKDGTPAGPYDSLEAATTAGAVVMAWGAFFNTIVSFLIVKWVNGLHRKVTSEAAETAAPPELTANQQLLTEIRDALKTRAVG